MLCQTGLLSRHSILVHDSAAYSCIEQLLDTVVSLVSFILVSVFYRNQEFFFCGADLAFCGPVAHSTTHALAVPFFSGF